MPTDSSLYLISLLSQDKGLAAQILPYLIEGKEIPSEVKYKPLSGVILRNLVDKIAEMKQNEKDRLLAALILKEMGETQTGEFRDALVLTAHEEAKEILSATATTSKKEGAVPKPKREKGEGYTPVF
jgi:ribosomal protein S24E